MSEDGHLGDGSLLQREMRRTLRETPQVQFGQGGIPLEEFRRHWDEIRIFTEGCVRTPEGIADIMAEADRLLNTPEGRAQVAELKKELMEDMGEGKTQTTEDIDRQDVDEAMEHLGIFNPKPGIPLETTVSGHEIVALSWRLKSIERRLDDLEDRAGRPVSD